MGKVTVRVENLWKKYRIGLKREAYGTLRDALASAVSAPLRLLRERSRLNDPKEFWALQGITFEVNQGEVLGIIGPNGAGKSTLLKILGRVAYPSIGHAEISGRVGSLLEVGTGFHPELTGRENIFLNGAILGMKKTEIQHKFDDIVAFAEINQFLDTPVKRYSNGMYLRLAFAVSAHLDPEILIVDEVLAVGDIDFQKKCLGKMNDVAKNEGRTVLFVSHNLDAVRRLCSRCLFLEGGKLTLSGESDEVVAHYLSRRRPPSNSPPETWIDVSTAERSGTNEARFTAAKYSSLNAMLAGQPYPNGSLEFLFEIESNSARSLGSLAVSIRDRYGNLLVNADSIMLKRVLSLRAGRNLVRLQIEHLHLNPGMYGVSLWLADPIRAMVEDSGYDYIEHAFSIEVVNTIPGEDGNIPYGMVTCDFDLVELQ